MALTRAPQLRGKIIADAEADGWRVREIKSRDGWPELYLAHEDTGALICAWVKDPGGRMTAAQASVRIVLEAVAAASGGAVRVRVWRPDDRDAIEYELRRAGGGSPLAAAMRAAGWTDSQIGAAMDAAGAAS